MAQRQKGACAFRNPPPIKRKIKCVAGMPRPRGSRVGNEWREAKRVFIFRGWEVIEVFPVAQSDLFFKKITQQQC